MSLVAFEIPLQVTEAIEALRQHGLVLVFTKVLPALERRQMRANIREQLCELVAESTGASRENVCINNCRGVPPNMLVNGDPVYVSISHCSTLSCAAVSLNTNIGLDIADKEEIKGSVDLLETAKLFLPPYVTNSLNALSGKAQASAFCLEWAKREASLKCLGLPMVEWSQDDPCLRRELKVELMSIEDHYIVALAAFSG